MRYHRKPTIFEAVTADTPRREAMADGWLRGDFSYPPTGYDAKGKLKQNAVQS